MPVYDLPRSLARFQELAQGFKADCSVGINVFLDFLHVPRLPLDIPWPANNPIFSKGSYVSTRLELTQYLTPTFSWTNFPRKGVRVKTVFLRH